jgi:integrase/recombinase XerD
MSTLRNKLIQQMELKGYSPRTIKVYTFHLLQLSRHFNTSPDLLSLDQIKEYLHLIVTERKCSRSWMNQLVSALKILFCEVLKREWKLWELPRAKREQKLPVILSREEVCQLLQATSNLKHRAVLMLTYSSSLRLHEVKSLKIQDIDSKRMLVRVVQSKGCKDRYTILSPVALKMLREYWNRYRPGVWLFETMPGKAMADRTAQLIFKHSLTKAGIKKAASFHTLRHSFATHLMEQGVSMPIIQQLLGHKSLRTTSGYLHVQQYSVDAVKSPLDTLSL